MLCSNFESSHIGTNLVMTPGHSILYILPTKLYIPSTLNIDLHVFTLKFLAWQKLDFPHKKWFPNSYRLLFTFVLCNFSVWTIQCFQKTLKLIFYPWKLKKRASKVAHNWSKPFFHSPAKPTAQNWFFIS